MCDHCRCRDFPPIAELSAEMLGVDDEAWTLLAGTARFLDVTTP
ncbi:MAG TPA: hypothetical protein VFU93_09995 [Acidimicrobiales bacterium]|nr:hypothetical protein [Acidimicrobiales bacterium]